MIKIYLRIYYYELEDNKYTSLHVMTRKIVRDAGLWSQHHSDYWQDALTFELHYSKVMVSKCELIFLRACWTMLGMIIILFKSGLKCHYNGKIIYPILILVK